MTKCVLITGGAGYIGSHAVKLFLEKGCHVVVIDNLSRGLRNRWIRCRGLARRVYGTALDQHAALSAPVSVLKRFILLDKDP